MSVPTKKILTVDDSEVVFRNIGSLISDNNRINWVGHAFTLDEAYDLTVANELDIIILDINLREGSSLDFLAYLTENRPHIIVIMFTNLSTPPYREKCKKIGAKYFFDKSEEFEKIPLVLEELSS